jgi:hypothetical protein
MEEFATLRKKYGFKVCLDIDDYWELDDSHILYEAYKEVNFSAVQRQHIVYADVVLTTHERLAKEIRKYNENVHVCPNAIPHQGSLKFRGQGIKADWSDYSGRGQIHISTT